MHHNLRFYTVLNTKITSPIRLDCANRNGILGADLATGRTMGALCTYVLYSQLFLREASLKLVKFPNCHESPVAIGSENLTSLKQDFGVVHCTRRARSGFMQLYKVPMSTYYCSCLSTLYHRMKWLDSERQFPMLPSYQV